MSDAVDSPGWRAVVGGVAKTRGEGLWMASLYSWAADVDCLVSALIGQTFVPTSNILKFAFRGRCPASGIVWANAEALVKRIGPREMAKIAWSDFESDERAALNDRLQLAPQANSAWVSAGWPLCRQVARRVPPESLAVPATLPRKILRSAFLMLATLFGNMARGRSTRTVTWYRQRCQRSHGAVLRGSEMLVRDP